MKNLFLPSSALLIAYVNIISYIIFSIYKLFVNLLTFLCSCRILVCVKKVHSSISLIQSGGDT